MYSESEYGLKIEKMKEHVRISCCTKFFDVLITISCKRLKTGNSYSIFTLQITITKLKHLLCICCRSFDTFPKTHSNCVWWNSSSYLTNDSP